MEELKRCIYQIRSAVFKGNYQEAMERTVGLLGDLLANETVDTLRVKKIAEKLMLAMKDRDYLLLADVVYFEVPDLWNGNQEEIDWYLQEEKLRKEKLLMEQKLKEDLNNGNLSEKFTLSRG